MPPPSLLEWIACGPWAEGVTILFGFAWGAMLGSFLNVVVHRVPLGESVVVRRSRCPACGHAIRAADNVPVLGWLRLGGRCRDCQAPIAADYALVEAGCGLVVAVLAATHLAAGGRWLPRLADQFPHGIDRLLRGDWRLLVACGLHAGAVLTIVAWSLLERRGWRASSRSLLVALMAMLLVIALVPAVGPTGLLLDGGDWPAGVEWRPALAATAAGGLAGWLAGRACRSRAAGLGLPLAGSVLGWQSLTIVAVVTIIVDRATSRGPWCAGIVLAVLTAAVLAFPAPLGEILTAGARR
ncbi:MAG: prepilin peptidase [Planctomycetota bacterium]